MLNVVTSQFVVLASSLVLALITGASRKYGHRMERLFDLAERLPEGTPSRQRFEEAAQKEAARLSRTVNDRLYSRLAWTYLRFLFVYFLPAWAAMTAVLRLVARPVGLELGQDYARQQVLAKRDHVPLALYYSPYVLAAILASGCLLAAVWLVVDSAFNDLTGAARRVSRALGRRFQETPRPDRPDEQGAGVAPMHASRPRRFPERVFALIVALCLIGQRRKRRLAARGRRRGR